EQSLEVDAAVAVAVPGLARTKLSDATVSALTQTDETFAKVAKGGAGHPLATLPAHRPRRLAGQQRRRGCPCNHPDANTTVIARLSCAPEPIQVTGEIAIRLRGFLVVAGTSQPTKYFRSHCPAFVRQNHCCLHSIPALNGD